MGKTSTYKCTKCNYSVSTSTGPDLGMIAVVEAHTCGKCNNIVDVTVGKFGKVYSKEELAMHPERNKPGFYDYKCPKCGDGSELVKWDNKKRPCPQCNGKLNIDLDGKSVLWD
jgi:DNA-directed RNA polymerase subunit RPC12/RpoP